MRLDFSGYDVSVSEHCGPFRPLGMKSARQIDRICFKVAMMQYLRSSFMIYTAALFSEEACKEWIGYYGWPICGVWHWPQR